MDAATLAPVILAPLFVLAKIVGFYLKILFFTLRLPMSCTVAITRMSIIYGKRLSRDLGTDDFVGYIIIFALDAAIFWLFYRALSSPSLAMRAFRMSRWGKMYSSHR